MTTPDPRAWLDQVDARTNAATDGRLLGVLIRQARTDLPAATTALRAVLDLADMWDSRADHDLEALKAFPVEVQDALYGQAWDMKHKANYIRAAITTALEDV